ncbi:replication factor-a protein 1 (rpa1) subfamily protein [Besnoitia besnoiti]|uniref:Replication protein A subunit n=1 Tax=Besnoitia besnoiti TaxID=94643 RepID=A0A2A9MN20_BESBE|nr:replication factor-a protein 1 (rpa1) subfamily protein [Besnoitia besnoiti]PFH37233.1 replication factor-a protein 1 (rpa1) subfamily protein [Besnoitia besnoiti]
MQPHPRLGAPPGDFSAQSPARAHSSSFSARSAGASASYGGDTPHFDGQPPPGFPPQVSFGFLTKFADAAFALQRQKGVCPSAQELLQLVDPHDPALLCLAALHAKNKTIITVSDGVSWCRIASTQLPPLAPGASEPPTEEDLNAAALALSGCVIRLGQISITRTPRGKHIILARAFQVLSRDYHGVAERLQMQQRAEVAFPSLQEAGAPAAAPSPCGLPHASPSHASSSSAAAARPLHAPPAAHAGEDGLHGRHAASHFPQSREEGAAARAQPLYVQRADVRAQPLYPPPRDGGLPSAGGPQRSMQSLASHRVAPYASAGSQQGQHGMRPAESFIPLKDLTAYVAKWTIRARVDIKGDIRKFNGARGPGQLFNVELKDKDGEIRATFFNTAVDKWFNVLQEGKVYCFRGGTVKPKNPRFNQTRHDYEITFDERSTITEVEGGDDIPSVTADLVDICGVEQKEVNSTISLMAVVHDYRPVQSITIKSTGQQKPKRDVYLVDEGGASLALTLWGDKADAIPEEQLSQKPVVLLKNVKVGDWNGKKLDSQGHTRIELFPDSSRAAELQDWWNREGSQRSGFTSISGGGSSSIGRKEVLKSLEQVAQEAAQAEASVLSDKGVYATCCALLERVGDDRFSWPACPDCRKKMSEDMPGCWVCPSCRKQCEQPNHTYMLNLSLMDVTGSLRCSCIGDKAEEFMSHTKAETVLLLAEHRALDEEGRSFQDIFADANLEEWIFRICSKYDSWMDEVSIKQRVVAAAPLFRQASEQTQHRLDFVRSAFHHLNIPLP